MGYAFFLFTPLIFLTGSWISALHRILPLPLKFYISGANAVPPQRDSNKDYHGITCEKHEYLAKKPKILRIEPTSSQKTMNRTIKTMHQIALVFALGSCIKNA